MSFSSFSEFKWMTREQTVPSLGLKATGDFSQFTGRVPSRLDALHAARVELFGYTWLTEAPGQEETE